MIPYNWLIHMDSQKHVHLFLKVMSDIQFSIYLSSLFWFPESLFLFCLHSFHNIHLPDFYLSTQSSWEKKVVDRLRGGFYCAEVCMSRLSSFKLDLVHG